MYKAEKKCKNCGKNNIHEIKSEEEELGGYFFCNAKCFHSYQYGYKELNKQIDEIIKPFNKFELLDLS